MASCNVCGKEVGCGCNLTNGSCHSCIGKTTEATSPLKKSTQRVVYSNTVEPRPNTEFEQILMTTTLSKAEKIRRINEILEKAKQV